MFATLSDRLSNIVSSIKGKAVITEDDFNLTLREIRVALLEADVSIVVVKLFIDNVRKKIIGKDILKSIQPSHMIIKLVNEELIKILGSSNNDLNINVTPPAVILFCGLQGSGKTTSVAKIAKLLKLQKKKKVLVVSLDIYRPAAQEQLEILCKQIDIDFINNSSEKNIENIANQALTKAKKEFYDILLIDTAGRQVIKQDMMNELIMISKLVNPVEKILVADSLTGQDAANVANQFNEKIGLTGTILTRIDGDGRGGAALSIKSITGAPIKYLCDGEKIDQIEEFHPDRIASRILGMGDIVTLVEKAAENIENEDLEKLSRKLKKGDFDLIDFSKQLRQMKKMGGVSGMFSMLPGISQVQKKMLQNNVNEDIIVKQLAIIDSMTNKERTNPDIIKASRKIRISKGSGTKVQEINRLLKQFFQSKKMMKKFGSLSSNRMPTDLINQLSGNMPRNFNN